MNEYCFGNCEYLKTASDLFETAAVKKDHIDGLNIWIGTSDKDETSVRMKNLYQCVLEKLGANILKIDFSAILDGRVGYDVLLMFTFTLGSSTRAIELVTTSKYINEIEKEKLQVFMPKEYQEGYICKKLTDHRVPLYYKDRVHFDRLDKDVFLKCIGSLTSIASDKKREREMTFNPRIAILTALPHEFSMMKQLLTDKRLDKSLGDVKVQFPHGRIGSNDVVVGMSGKGNNLSSAIATKIYAKYPSVEYMFIVGIAGGIPDFEKPAESIRLGDIVLSNEKGILQYDKSKTTTSGKEDDFDPRPPDAILLRNAKMYLEPINNLRRYKYWGYLDELLNQSQIVRPEEEVLDESPWIEDYAGGVRARLPKNKRKRPRLHFGPIASANTVLKDISVRKQLKEDYKAKAVEMEASGVADAAWLEKQYCFVVRGICDYANPNKNDEWQKYAAAAAAAFTQEIIEETLSD